VGLYRSGQSVNYLSSEYVVSNISIYKCIKQLSPVEISEGKEISVKEYQAMQKHIAELEMECEILKKATAIFARTR
jgi:transposase